MTAAVLTAFLCIFSGLSGALIAWSVTHEPIGRVLQGLIRRRLVVTLKTGSTFAGVLTEADRHALVLQSTDAVSPDGSRIRLDGDLVLLLEDIGTIQRP